MWLLLTRALCYPSVGQATGSREHLKRAQQFFQLVGPSRTCLVLCKLAPHADTTVCMQVGASASECDTIPGRQCMASCFFLLKQFDDVNIYLSSVKVCGCVAAWLCA